MNSNDMKNFSDKKNSINKKIEILNLFIKDFENEKSNLLNNCNHEIIVIYTKLENKVYGEIKIGKCLICNKNIEIFNNYDIRNNTIFNDENLIDISNYDSEFFGKITNKFNEIINNEQVYNCEEIINELKKCINIKKKKYEK